MIGFEVSVNGDIVTRAGLESPGVLEVSLKHALRGGPVEHDNLSLTIEGFVENESVTWTGHKPGKRLSPGDVLEIRIFEAPNFDKPSAK